MTPIVKRCVAVIAVVTFPLWILPWLFWLAFIGAVESFERIVLSNEGSKHGR